MKKTHKKKLQKNYANLSAIFNGKSNYLKNLEKKRNDGLRIIREQKQGIMLDDIFRINKFKRDYSCFPFNSPILEDKGLPLNIHLSQAIKYYIEPKIEKEYTRKNNASQCNHFEIPKNNDKFNNYEFPKSNLPVNYAKNSKYHRNKILENVGKQIITRSNSRSDNNRKF